MKREPVSLKMKQSAQRHLPKVPISNERGQFSSSSPNRTKPKQSTSPTMIKEFLKLFKNSNSNTRILKISPYCNITLKNKIIHALGNEGKRDSLIIQKPRKENQITARLSARGKYNYSGNFKTDEISAYVKDKNQEYCLQRIIVDFGDDRVVIQVSQEVLDDSGILSSVKIAQAVKNRLTKHKLATKCNKIVGFKIINWKSTTNPKSPTSKHHDTTNEERKGLTQLSSYLLEQGRLNLKDKKYRNYEDLVMKPIIPKRDMHWTRGSSRGKISSVDMSDFDIVKCLGSGGFSTVFLVRGNFNGKYYAMKLISKEFIIETERDGIVENQRFILQKLSSQTGDKKGSMFITQLSFCFETASNFVFMLQYCPGGQLFNQLKKVRKMTQDQAKFYFLEILIALDHIHSFNILYRDLKPQNLLIDAKGHIKIADFGLSKPLNNFRSVSYSFCGSPEYMAPEMLTKSGHNYTLDYYCLGALLYELVLGVPPYYSLKQQEIYQSILNQDLAFPQNTNLSPEIMNLLSGLLKKDPKQRLGSLYGVKQIMYHPWIGRINRTTIQNKQMKPPFVPDLGQDNFDASDIKADVVQILARIKEDIKKGDFQTYFSDQFAFVNPKQKLQYLNTLQSHQPQPLKAQTSRRSYLLRSASVPISGGGGKLGSPFSFRNLTKQKQKQAKKQLIFPTTHSHLKQQPRHEATITGTNKINFRTTGKQNCR